MTYHPKTYVNNGRQLDWGVSIPIDKMKALRAGEIFTLVDITNGTVRRVFMDCYNQLKEKILQ